MPCSSTTLHRDNEGGITKHACALAALSWVLLLTAWDLFVYFSTHRVDVALRTANPLHSPEEGKDHYFHKGEFLNYQQIDLKIDIYL